MVRPWCLKHDCYVLGYIADTGQPEIDVSVDWHGMARTHVFGLEYGCVVNDAVEGMEGCGPTDWGFRQPGEEPLES